MQVVCLIVTSQTGARDVAQMMFTAPGVTFALVNPVMCESNPAYCISLRVLSKNLRQLWSWLFTTSRDALLACGLTAVVLQSGTFVWLRDPALTAHSECSPYSPLCLVVLVWKSMLAFAVS